MRLLVLSSLFVAVAAAAAPQQSLPSAPSAVKQEQTQPVYRKQQKEAPAAPPSAPAQQPATQSPAPVQQAPTAPARPQATTDGMKEGAAQQDPRDDGDYRFITRADEVNVIFTVTDKRGRFIRNLKAADFKILDDKRQVNQIRNFTSETDLPLRVGLLIDTSASIRDRFKFEQDAAIEFLTTIVRPRQDKAFVIGFDSVPEVVADLTDNSERLSAGVRSLRPGGGTALYDAIYGAARDRLRNLKERSPIRKVIIVLSDGEDNQSRVTREEAIEMAQRAEVIVYAISTNESGNESRGDKVLERIANATGGQAFFPIKLEDVRDHFQEISEALRSQYVVAYKPENFLADGRYRSIEIQPLNRKLRAHARSGYFAPRE